MTCHDTRPDFFPQVRPPYATDDPNRCQVVYRRWYIEASGRDQRKGSLPRELCYGYISRGTKCASMSLEIGKTWFAEVRTKANASQQDKAKSKGVQKTVYEASAELLGEGDERQSAYKALGA